MSRLLQAYGRSGLLPLWMDDVAARHVGKPINDETIEAVAADMLKASKPVPAKLLSPGYRRQMERVMTSRAVREIRGDEFNAETILALYLRFVANPRAVRRPGRRSGA